MLNIVVGGQIDKEEIKQKLEDLFGDKATMVILSDIEAANKIKQGEADYYIGACNTGGGGALSLAIALLGYDKCATLSMPSNIKSEEEIIQEVQSEKLAFGFTASHKDQVLPLLVKALLEKSEGRH